MLASGIVVYVVFIIYIMQDLTYIYHAPTEDVPVVGFLAFLLQQGEAWDIRCLEADARDYHAQQYARMHPTVALQQELQWWMDVVNDERLDTLPNRDELLESGLTYLQWRVYEQITPLSHSEMLNAEMTIRIDENHGIYKLGYSLGVFEHSTPEPLHIIHGFPAQLLTYAACTTMDAYIRQVDIADPIAWVDSILGWLESPAVIMMCHIQFAIPDVYQLYDAYLSGAKAQWEANNHLRYQSGIPQMRYFMTRLLEQTKSECDDAIRDLLPYLSEKQHAAFMRYLTECQQYIQDRITTKRKERSDELCQYYGVNGVGKSRHIVTRELREAATHPTNPAVELARVVRRLQSQRALVADLRPLTRFIATINKAFGTNIKYDSFSKHFRN